MKRSRFSEEQSVVGFEPLGDGFRIVDCRRIGIFGCDPIPKFELYYAAVNETTGETVAVSESAVGVLADAAEKTGLPRDCFEVHQISREEYERLKEP